MDRATEGEREGERERENERGEITNMSASALTKIEKNRLRTLRNSTLQINSVISSEK